MAPQKEPSRTFPTPPPVFPTTWTLSPTLPCHWNMAPLVPYPSPCFFSCFPVFKTLSRNSISTLPSLYPVDIFSRSFQVPLFDFRVSGFFELGGSSLLCWAFGHVVSPPCVRSSFFFRFFSLQRSLLVQWHMPLRYGTKECSLPTHSVALPLAGFLYPARSGFFLRFSPGPCASLARPWPFFFFCPVFFPVFFSRAVAFHFLLFSTFTAPLRGRTSKPLSFPPPPFS